jgi:hypothetical protein
MPSSGLASIGGASSAVPTASTGLALALNTRYQNTTGKTLFLSVNAALYSDSLFDVAVLEIKIGPTTALAYTAAYADYANPTSQTTTQRQALFAVVPPSWYYQVDNSGSVNDGNGSISSYVILS